jgi:hypothetical protein
LTGFFPWELPQLRSPAGTASLQNANPATQTVSRRPQTSVPAENVLGSFVRESRRCSQVAFTQAGNTFGTLITKPLKPVPGFLRGLWIVVQATGGVNAGTTTATADAPYNVIQSVQLRDAFGTVVFQTDGYGLFLVHLYSVQVGAAGFQQPSTDPWWVAIATGAAGSGNFTFALFLPLEFDPDTGYCSLPAMNAAAEMTLSIQLSASGTVYSAAPTTLPLIEVDVYQEYWAVPISDPNLTPPDDGSSHQWTQSQGNVGVASQANSRVQLPDVGTYLSTIILLFRDSTNARIDTPFSSDIELWVDSVPVRIEHSKQLFSRMGRQFGLTTRPTGVAVYSFRDSVGFLTNVDDMELLLPTTPGTLLEVFSGAWGTFSNSPATINTYTGKLYPVGEVPERVV